MVEPPSLFLGRGDHPKSGTLKLRVHPKDVTLNLSEEAKVPLAPNGYVIFFLQKEQLSYLRQLETELFY